jgi:flagellum-specific peptidoglycan hydrolase FlgJ
VNAQQNAFLKMAVPLAQAAQKKWGVPASVTITQAILESSNAAGWGQSQLAREANNFFGIKAEHLNDPETYIELPTTEFVHGEVEHIEAGFERYIDPQDSFDDHARLLATAKRYAPAMAERADSDTFACRLQTCGYSTSPTYAKQLIAIMRLYDLTQFDIPPEDPAAAQAQEAAA